MKKKSNIEVETNSYTETFGADSNIYTHAVFTQCVLPVRSLAKNVNYYQVKHGDSSLMIQSGVLLDGKGCPVQMEVPSGAKARLLFPYIINQAIRNESAQVDMGANLYSFMKENGIEVGGKNAKELQRQVNNIAASSINVGVWGTTETHTYSSQKTYRVASEVSFWNEKEVNQLTFWNPTLTISDELMATLTNHRVLIDMKSLIALQNNPRAMDMYMWLSYRTRNLKRPTKITYKDLHSIFGQQTKLISDFKKNFKRALKLANLHLTDAYADFETDKKHLILRSKKHQLYMPGTPNKFIADDIPIEGGVFGELESIGLPKSRIKKLVETSEEAKIKKALDVTKQSMEKGTVKNPAGFFTKALKEEWEPAKQPEANKVIDPVESAKEIDKFEEKISDQDWKNIRIEFRKQYSDATFCSWIQKKLIMTTRKSERVTLLAESRFIAEYVEKNYGDFFTKQWKAADDKITQVRITYFKKK